MGKRLMVRASKTDAGVRQVDLFPIVHGELVAHKAATSAGGCCMSGVELTGGSPRNEGCPFLKV